jgi:hypothetical protein
MNAEIYNNYINPQHPTAFSAPGNIKRFKNSFGRGEITRTLNANDTYTLHREYHRPRVRNPYFVYNRRDQLQVDLIDVSNLKKHNNNVTFLLAAIDVFSKYAWVKPLQRKSGNDTLIGIKSIISAMRLPPRSIFFDRGKEFTNAKVNTYLKRNNINVIHPSSEIKAGVAERFNRTLQDLMYKYMTENETKKYINVLQDLVNVYNNRGHRTLQYLTPKEAEDDINHKKVVSSHNINYAKIISKRKGAKYKVGQRVRINILKNRFEKGYEERFTREHFEITTILDRQPIVMYKVRSLNDGQTVKGGFYEEELQPSESEVFKVEKVLKTRRHRGQLQYFVKWQNYGNEHNSWINANDIARKY